MNLIPEQYQLYLALAAVLVVVCGAIILTGLLVWYFDSDNRGNRRNARLHGRRATDKRNQRKVRAS